MVTLRIAKKEDIEEVVELWWQNHLFHIEELDAGKDFAYLPDAKERIRSHFNDTVIPAKNIVVAIQDNKVVGFVEFAESVRPPIYKINKAFHIWNVFVLPKFRKKGIGSLLVRESLKIGKERGYEEVELEAHVKNTEAIEFYSSLDLRKRMIQFLGKI